MPSTDRKRPTVDIQAAQRVVRHVAGLIERGEIGPGGRLPAERELAEAVGVSRPTVRAGLQALAAMGVTEARQGSGTYITDGPPRLGAGPLSFLAALHGFTRDEMFEARKVLEAGAAALAAERGQAQLLAPMAEEIVGMFATLDDPKAYLEHDSRFHRALAAAAGNPVLLALVEMVSTLAYERRRLTVDRARDLRTAAEAHRRIYEAVRDRDANRARTEVSRHLDAAREAQAAEDLQGSVLPSQHVDGGTAPD
jgi:GntR family transcriptional repressor for pyruvate dehydrogenase complex